MDISGPIRPLLRQYLAGIPSEATGDPLLFLARMGAAGGHANPGVPAFLKACLLYTSG